jgi:serpin B
MLDSEKRQETSLMINKVDLTALVEGNNAFAFDLYQSLKRSGDNLFYSPYSISEALAMVYAGARGETADEMVDMLHFARKDDRLHQAFKSIDLELSLRGTKKKGRNRKGFELYTINALWAQKGCTFSHEFLTLLAEDYGTGIRIADFVKKPEQSRITINKWISDRTKERIRDLMPQGAIDASARLVATNAVYFNAAWKCPFDQAATFNSPFYLLDGNTIVVPMMKQSESFGYAEGETYQAVDLCYDGSELSMVVLLPGKQQFATFQESLNAELASGIISKLKYKEVILSIPRFKYGCGFSLNEALTAMGMSHAFSQDADFSGMTSDKGFFINNFMHSAFISVDEVGTEATAVSTTMATAAEPEEPVEVIVNRPFIFLIRDIATKAILFVGRVIDPGIFMAL